MKPRALNRITIWDHPGSRMFTQWGSLRYEDWCAREVERIKAMGQWAKVIERNGNVAVAR